MKYRYRLLTEYDFDQVQFDTEINESTKEKSMYITGVTLQGNVKNRNGRIYPSDILDETVYNYLKENEEMTMEGELKHPEKNAHIVNEEKISHRFVSLIKEGNNWISKALVLDTPKGQIVQSLMKGGVKLGISSRCLGQVKKENNASVVQRGLKMVTPGDVVRRPSAPDAIIQAIYESKEYIYENGLLVEKDLSQDLDVYRKMISETTKKDRARVFSKIFNSYLESLNL